MSTLGESIQSKPYLSIIGGRLTKSVQEGTPGAVKREYEDSKGNKGIKFEIQYPELTGRIEELRFEKHKEYGESLKVIFDDIILSIGLKSKYYKAFAQKIPSADINKEITFSPYDYIKNGERKNGMSMQQDGKELVNFCWDSSKNSYIESYPKFKGDWDTASEKEQILYGLERAEYLRELVNSVIPNINMEISSEGSQPEPEETTEDALKAMGAKPVKGMNGEDLAF